MNKWIQFNINHPKIVLLILGVITIIALTGLTRLHFDSSTDALMPKQDPSYLMGERAKRIFGDNKSMLLVAIEPVKGEKIFSNKIFSHINNLVTELEEFRTFNFEQEEKRLHDLLDVGNITVMKDKSIIKEQFDKTSRINDKKADIDLDTEILGDESSKGSSLKNDVNNKDRINETDIWDISKPLKGDLYVDSIRKRNIYNYDRYKPVTLKIIKEKLDPYGKMQLETILRANKLIIKDGDELNRNQFKTILENWETVYLYKSMEIIKEFINPISGQEIQGTNNELKMIDLISKDDNGIRKIPNNEEGFQEYKKILKRNPFYESLLYALDSEGEIQALSLYLTLRPLRSHDEIFDYFYEVIQKYNHSPVVLSPVGSPIFQKFLKDYMQEDLIKFMPMVIIVIIIIFYLNFRLFRGVLLPTLSVFIGAIWTLGLMGHIGVPITLVVNILPPLIFAVGSSYSIHIFNQYLQDQKMISEIGLKKGLSKSVNHISLTVMLAGLTTFIGFITLIVNQEPSLQDFGLYAAIGTMFAVVISIMLIPSALMLMKLLPINKVKDFSNESSTKEKSQNVAIFKIVDLFNHLTINHSRSVIFVTLLLVIIFFYGITKIKPETGPLYNFKKDSYVYQSDLLIGKLFKGTFITNLIIDSGKKDGAKDPEFLKLIEEIRQWITSPEGQKVYNHFSTSSFGDIIKRMHMAMNGDDPKKYGIPDSESAIRDYMELFSGDDRDSDGRVDILERFVSPNYQQVNIMIRSGSIEGSLFSTGLNKKGLERIKNYLNQHPVARKYNYHIIGESVNFTIVSDLIVYGQITNVLMTIIIIGIIIFLLFKNWKAGLVSIIPISIAVIFVYGIMGFLGIPLDIPKALLSAVAIGIGVDDTIHMMKTIRYNLSKGFTLQESIIISHKESGLAIMYTSVALIFGFSVLLFSEFVPVFYLGWLVSLTMIFTTIGALLILPSIIMFFKLPLNQELKWPIFRWINIGKFFEIDE